MARRHREILDTLLGRVVDGTHPPGELLPKETLIAEEFDVSRGTGREALRALEERRVAVVRHGRGATVQPPEEWNVLDGAVAGALVTGRRRKAFLTEIAELRRMLEPEAAGLAAERASAKEREAIRNAPTPAERRRLISNATGNRPLASTLRALWDMHPPSDDGVEVAAAVAGGDVAAARSAALRSVG